MSNRSATVRRPRFQEPNPVDLLFFARDQVRKRLGLPRTIIQLHLEMRGQLDVDGLRRALSALYRVYPAAGSRLQPSPVTGRPRWRLDVDMPDFNRVVRVHRLAQPSADELHRQTEMLLASPIDTVQLPPVQFHVFRGPGPGDLVVVRWPHAFMDARGGATLLEELERLYREAPDPDVLSSAGDELREDFAGLIAGIASMDRPRLLLDVLRGMSRVKQPERRLPRPRVRREFGPMRYLVRRFSPRQTRQVMATALRVCGLARFSDFLRASAIRALSRATPGPPHFGYSTLNLVDSRKRRQRGPVCRNLFSALPICVPTELAAHRRAVADLIQQQNATMLASREPARRLAAAHMLAQLPTAVLAAVMHRGLMPGDSPSLPMGFMGPFARPMPTFCGAELVNIYGLRPPHLGSGFAVDVNSAQDRLNIACVYCESSLATKTANAFLDDLAAALVSPD